MVLGGAFASTLHLHYYKSVVVTIVLVLAAPMKLDLKANEWGKVWECKSLDFH